MYTTSTNAARPQIRSSIPIIVYGTNWCAASQMVRRHLDRLYISYVYLDIESNLAAGHQVRWWTGGALSHPTVRLGGQILVEPGLDELNWALRRAGIA